MKNNNFTTKPTPKDWPRVAASVFYQDAAKAIDWLCTAFGFEIRLKVEGEAGTIVHSELDFGPDGMVMVSSEASKHRPDTDHNKSPRSVGGANTQALMAFVDDCDAHCAHARAHGATITVEPKTSDYGAEYWTDRSYEAVDLEGHHWWFVQRVRG